jgi:hypothetical protein
LHKLARGCIHSRDILIASRVVCLRVHVGCRWQVKEERNDGGERDVDDRDSSEMNYAGEYG